MEIHIVLCTDGNYVKPATVTIASICANNQNNDLVFHIVTEESQKTVVESIKSAVTQWNQRFLIHTIGTSSFALLPCGLPGQPLHVSRACYFRLFLGSLLPNDIDRVLYLDCDIIVRHSLDSLWQTEMADYAIACVDDMYNLDPDKYNTLKYYPSSGYFNSGVLLINLKYWRENKLEEEFLDFARKYPERIIFHDQDILNFVLKDRKLRLPFTYNVQDGFLYETRHFLWWPYEKEYKEAITDPCVVHYSIRFKPWHKDCMHPWKDEYLKYVELANLNIGSFPQRHEKLNLYQRLRTLLVKFGILSPLLSFSTDVRALK